MLTLLLSEGSLMLGKCRLRSEQSWARCLFSEGWGKVKSEGQSAKPSALSAMDFRKDSPVSAPQTYLALRREHRNGSRTHDTTWANRRSETRYERKLFLGLGLQRQRLNTSPNQLSAHPAMLWPDLGSRELTIEKVLSLIFLNHRSVFLLMS